MSASAAIGALPLYGAEPRRVSLARIQVSMATTQEALAGLDQCVEEGSGHYFCFCEANLFVHAQRTPRVMRALSGANMVFADGVCLLLLAKLLGKRRPWRISGPSFILAACEHGVERGYRHYFYGGAPGVAERLAENLGRKYPGIQIVGAESPPFRPLTAGEEDGLRERIEAARPDLLWVGLGGPKQELWMAEHVGKLKVPVMLGVGAAFDFHSGNRKWAPKWIRKSGMEWAYRAITGGRRVFLRNAWCVSKALLYIARELVRARFAERSRRREVLDERAVTDEERGMQK